MRGEERQIRRGFQKREGRPGGADEGLDPGPGEAGERRRLFIRMEREEGEKGRTGREDALQREASLE